MAEFFSTNLKHLREEKRLSQSELARRIGVNQTTIARWEEDNRVPTIDNAVDVATVLNIPLEKLLGVDLRFDNAELINEENNAIKIPVLGAIKAGMPIEAQEDIIEYVDIPKNWIKGNKKYYGLKIMGDSMFPKYQEDDIVIFEQTEDYLLANKKDCAVMVNGFDATFKNVTITESGITLVPLNLNNSDNYQPTFYNQEQVKNLPVKIIGIAREKRTRL